MACRYCVREKTSEDMSTGVLYKTCDLAFSKGRNAGLIFFGGEPLLRKDLIYSALDYCEKKSHETGMPFGCKMTTNGTLLDEKFLARAKEFDMGIGLSFDGIGQDVARRFPDGSSSFALMEEKARLLLKFLPKSVALITIHPEACPMLFDSVKYLMKLGFKRISTVMAYGSKVTWTDKDLDVLRSEYNKIADLLRDEINAGHIYSVSPLTSKIRECVQGKNPAEHCHLGVRQMPVTPKGDIYPCTSFLNDEEYYLGNVFDGLDAERVSNIASRNNTPDTCKECDLVGRCTNSCGCANRLNTGCEDKVSPLQCTYERMVIEIADRLGDEIYSCDQAVFCKIFGK